MKPRNRRIVRRSSIDSAGSSSSQRSLSSVYKGLPSILKCSNSANQKKPGKLAPTSNQDPSGQEVSGSRVVSQAEINAPHVHFIQSVQDLRPEDIIVVVMGPTGTGKSTFIQRVTNCDWSVGHSLQSHTSQVNTLRAEYSDGTRLVLVDTPGFDDTNKSVKKILKIVAKWFKEVRQYRDHDHNELEISGILYLHRITDNRMAGTPMKNLKLFQKLCGSDFFSRVCFTTTMWAPEPEEDPWEQVYTNRQAELEGTYWASMIAEGARARQFRGTQQSASAILQDVISSAKGRCRTQILEIQQELVDLSKRLPATKAGQQLHCMIEELVGKQKAVLDRLRDEILSQTSDPQILRELIVELNGLRRTREKAIKDMRRLDYSIMEWARRLGLWSTGMIRLFLREDDDFRKE